MPNSSINCTGQTQPALIAHSPKMHTAKFKTCFALLFFAAVFCSEGSLRGQDKFKHFNATSVFREMSNNATVAAQAPLVESWWDQHVQNSLREVQPLPADLHTLLYLAVHNSNQIKIAKADPLIRETAIQEADSAFDWVRYLDSAWNDTSEPVSNALTVGGDGTRFEDNIFQATAGARRTTRSGGQLDISQRFGWQDNNSQFFIPNDQATGRLTVSYTHPLLRGRGTAYNNSIVFLAQIDSQVANDEFLAILQEELLEITRVYWDLHLQRALLAHQMRLYLRTKEVYQTLSARQAVDTQGTQLILTASALESRRADLIRSQTAVTNAETRLRGMINAPELGNTDQTELIPVESLPSFHQHSDLQNEIQVALQNRPEVRAAVQQVKSGSIRLGVAQHELLPALNLVTQGFLSGLQGDSDFGEAFLDQFSTGRPSYSVGLQYELPVGNRLAKARVCRRQHELTRLQNEYSRALEAVQTEVDIAVRELNTSYREIMAKSRALAAAESEVTTIEQRWQRMIDGSGTSSLNLESLLRAQERVTAAEREYVTSRLTYSLAVVNLKRANGTLLQSEAISVSPTCNGQGCHDIHLDKAQPMSAFPVENISQAYTGPTNFAVNQAPISNTQSWESAVSGNSQPNGSFGITNTPAFNAPAPNAPSFNQPASTAPAAFGMPNFNQPASTPAAFGTPPRMPAFNQPAPAPTPARSSPVFSVSAPQAAPNAPAYATPAAYKQQPKQTWQQPPVATLPSAPVDKDNDLIFTELPKN